MRSVFGSNRAMTWDMHTPFDMRLKSTAVKGLAHRHAAIDAHGLLCAALLGHAGFGIWFFISSTAQAGCNEYLNRCSCAIREENASNCHPRCSTAAAATDHSLHWCVLPTFKYSSVA